MLSQIANPIDSIEQHSCLPLNSRHFDHAPANIGYNKFPVTASQTLTNTCDSHLPMKIGINITFNPLLNRGIPIDQGLRDQPIVEIHLNTPSIPPICR
ncbi:hypothetical protein A2U01_0022982 [Trifolium medium]|uniref:Uncharacterized protein n=1 Tax=Trifolium medium TaxID=97028 RepID=A0A392NRD6_9FABA|nr:hypothetical protein [Trifolium medium]